MHYLVVGGTGILRPAAEELARREDDVTVVARRAANEPPRIFGATVDVSDVLRLGETLDAAVAARGPFEAALVYAPFANADSMRVLASRASGILVYVLTSQWGAPDTERSKRDALAPDGTDLTHRLTLGWTYDRNVSRWHSPEEVSRATLEALDSEARESTLGTLRPWSDKPSS